jgi:dephospho-CoA kinase
MKVIGLTGSIAMGKSEVAKIFRENGSPVFDADAEVHALYASTEGADLLRELVPEAVTATKVDRKRLADIVLKDRDLLHKLETLVHARIAQKRDAFITAAKARGEPLVLLDIPLLFEKGTEKSLDATIVVSSPVHLQRARALSRPGMTEDRLNAILARQMPDAEKRQRATFVIENDGTLIDLRRNTLSLIDKLL